MSQQENLKWIDCFNPVSKMLYLGLDGLVPVHHLSTPPATVWRPRKQHLKLTLSCCQPGNNNPSEREYKKLFFPFSVGGEMCGLVKGDTGVWENFPVVQDESLPLKLSIGLFALNAKRGGHKTDAELQRF